MNPAIKWLGVNPTKPSDPNYSILNTLDNKCKDDKGKFMFKLVWPKRKGANYNIWKQSTNPVYEKTTVQGYEAVDVNFNSQLWGGLENGYIHGPTPSALLDGSVNHGKCVQSMFGVVVVSQVTRLCLSFLLLLLLLMHTPH